MNAFLTMKAGSSLQVGNPISWKTLEVARWAVEQLARGEKKIRKREFGLLSNIWSWRVIGSFFSFLFFGRGDFASINGISFY